ncbi:type II toxin-antitoxin system HicB family antitoxin [Sulfurihydrogenibium subterraneum]|uniref:type II toxin-antitoxin system HicB family antitoxin n=1 Tax=Sulfurihydrogenibium subterraneum TaxID=171121 RepID=UPI000688EB88|nr:type II toxin-antitoxin system HicB family antitoxin [Sulfurihydrogenibium subterraneum]
MKNVNEELDYYINMPYTIELIPDVESGGFVAKIVELEGCITFGDTREEALQMLEDAKREWIETALEEGFEIPLLKTAKRKIRPHLL